MLKFCFELRPLAEVSPWGRDDDPTLHWFGLTDGWFWIEVDGVELFRFSNSQLREWDSEPAYPYFDYFVVRLWEDVLEILADVLEPVPPELRTFVAGPREWDPEDDAIDDDEWNAFYEATLVARVWYGSRRLDAGYGLTPHIRWWRVIDSDSDVIWMSWDHGDAERSKSFAAPTTGLVSMPTTEFVAAVRDFDRRLLQEMSPRVADVVAGALDPSIRIDLDQLQREQGMDRAGWLGHSINRRVETDWEAVTRAARLLIAAPWFGGGVSWSRAD